jgi:hypothetical protein
MAKDREYRSGTLFSGATWFVFWLFTIGYVQLSFGKAVLAVVIWPWYLGNALSALGAGG